MVQNPTGILTMSLQSQLIHTADFIQSQCPERKIQGAVVLGSGLGVFADTLQNPVPIPFSKVPNFPPVTVQGHAGQLVIGDIAPGFTIACMQGRFHHYEGHDMKTVAFPTRVFKQLGAGFMIVTNAAGGINTGFKPGALMLITDHINLMGDNPLKGANFDFIGPRFPDMSEAYNLQLRKTALSVAKKEKIDLQQGVYAGLSGPCYETPAEIRMLRTLGADAVGMSTVPEVIAANHAALPILGISCITNLAAGLSDNKLSHDEVMETAEQVRNQFIRLLNGILQEIAAQPSLVAQSSL
jgi:purine-nucleoside phosphorylase